jgi:twitching motility two-component system response regulator PilH
MAQILVVDDSPTEAHVLKGMLEKHGFDVETAQNGTEGIERARTLKPDLILMDVVMPGLNGFQATRQLTRDPETSNIPIIIVTTKDQDTDRVWGLRQGAKDFLTKPVSERNLMEKIGLVLAAV